ncbi:hypothetical protein D8M04_08780 [Oceanobacillus piezotolerans]|uniref:Putative amidase domain-containing protein n=1 Tax=Oceanobacillus piezotolerans TaxID=2448030 RepID=A0A498D5K0_9BACI|nr:amidase domain-containing protein [Oceanobacillus piezotolerans]RLL44959.1 hypothetical protein D8M04_08780 [Oceanobacillus piezotolerans]
MKKIKQWWLKEFESTNSQNDWWERKKQLWKERDAEIVKVKGKGEIFQTLQLEGKTEYRYLLHLTYLIKQNKHFHIEEQVIPHEYRMKNGKVVDHKETKRNVTLEIQPSFITKERDSVLEEERFSYDRRAAVQYAERWWNSYNPAYRIFDVDCTNYISQCLRAGGAPMRGAPVRERGWWYSGSSWSYSWAVAHSLRWYLSGSRQGLKGKELYSAEDLLPGDIICYDFQGDGRWDHNTIVVTKDAYGMPLVNAHTDNSRHRYWSYEDSSAYTPDIQYKFFRIGE